MSYPGLVSNLGCKKIMVQALSQPDIHSTFELNEGADFVAFLDFNDIADIGFDVKS